MSVYHRMQEQGSQIVRVGFETTTVFYRPKQVAGSSDSSKFF